MGLMDSPLRTALDAVSTGTTDGGTLTLLLPHGWAIALGVAPGEDLRLCGFNRSGTYNNAIWPLGTAYPWATLDGGDQTLTVSSSDADDDDGDVGANTIRIWWLDAAGTEHTTDVTMDGVNAVVSAATTARRINRAEVLTVGATGANEGIISIYATDGATVLGHIAAGEGRMQQIVQTVPTGKQDVLRYSTVSYSARRSLMARSSSSVPWTLRRQIVSYDSSPPPNHTIEPPIILPAGTDYYLTTSAADVISLYGYRLTVT